MKVRVKPVSIWLCSGLYAGTLSIWFEFHIYNGSIFRTNIQLGRMQPLAIIDK
jgi:hypothetical protein